MTTNESLMLSIDCLSDYVSGGELFTHLYQRDHFNEDEVRIYIGEIILALEHLHKVIIAQPLIMSTPNPFIHLF